MRSVSQVESCHAVRCHSFDTGVADVRPKPNRCLATLRGPDLLGARGDAVAAVVSGDVLERHVAGAADTALMLDELVEPIERLLDTDGDGEVHAWDGTW